MSFRSSITNEKSYENGDKHNENADSNRRAGIAQRRIAAFGQKRRFAVVLAHTPVQVRRTDERQGHFAARTDRIFVGANGRLRALRVARSVATVALKFRRGFGRRRRFGGLGDGTVVAEVSIAAVCLAALSCGAVHGAGHAGCETFALVDGHRARSRSRAHAIGSIAEFRLNVAAYFAAASGADTAQAAVAVERQRGRGE